MAAINLQGVLARFLDRNQPLSSRQWQVCSHLQTCHTAALGGLKRHCDHCDYEVPQYHACRDRHCPQCQWRASRRWCEQQQAAVLPVAYYHLVFTLPHTLNRWVQLHPQVIYGLLFRCVWATLKGFAADPKRLGGELGMTAVLHTWGQNLSQHVHLHCLIPGGVLNLDGQWTQVRGHYLFPVRALSRVFRGKMVSTLRAAAQHGELHRITRPGDIDTTLDGLMQTEWVVYSKACVSCTESVVAYLARYSHRIAISDQRILGMEDDQVVFRYKDYRDHDTQKTMRLSGAEFIRRFLLHVLPKGLMRLRHYGFLANRCRAQKLQRIRAALGRNSEPGVSTKEDDIANTLEGYPCPKCHQGMMRVVTLLPPVRWVVH
ncbi:MAG: IS91-like element ISSod25 family transposase [Gammaproteobacteria bacterium]|nr:MAG: IS91-like element ISSod25 family transposase [Gammaproteobacteria bacterium]